MSGSNNFTEDREISVNISEVMSIEDEPILTIDQAKKYYIAMGCSHFHIAREHPTRRDEYRALQISSKLEHQWRNEDFLRRVHEFPI